MGWHYKGETRATKRETAPQRAGPVANLGGAIRRSAYRDCEVLRAASAFDGYSISTMDGLLISAHASDGY
jgi:hypothetical protein